MRCKTGDLAIIIGEEPGFEENLGIIVKIGNNYEGAWEIFSADMLIKTKEDDSPEIFYENEAVLEDKFLLPIGNKRKEVLTKELEMT